MPVIDVEIGEGAAIDVDTPRGAGKRRRRAAGLTDRCRKRMCWRDGYSLPPTAPCVARLHCSLPSPLTPSAADAEAVQGRALRLSRHPVVGRRRRLSRSSTIARRATSTSATRCRSGACKRAIRLDRRAQGAAGSDAEDRRRHVRHVAVGKTEGAAIITIYLHGQGGSRKQGVDDFTFGGNFNRIKNLMADNGGLYLSPDFSDFGDKGAAEIAALIDHYAEASPGAKIFVACGSMGGCLCWKLAANDASPGASRPAAARLAVGRRASSPAPPSSARCRSFSARAATTPSFRSRSRRPSSGRSLAKSPAIPPASCASRPARTARRSA